MSNRKCIKPSSSSHALNCKSYFTVLTCRSRKSAAINNQIRDGGTFDTLARCRGSLRRSSGIFDVNSDGRADEVCGEEGRSF